MPDLENILMPDYSKPLYNLLICSCDNYSDTWEPYFKLLSIYWPRIHELSIILTTDTRDFLYPGLQIVSSKVGFRRSGLPRAWGDVVRRSLDLTTSPIVLLMLDDFFIFRPVYGGLVEEFSKKMLMEGWARVES